MVDNKKQTGSKRYLMKNDSMKSQYRINEQIRAKEVRIVGDDVEPKVYPIFQALKLAEEKEMDLVEISPNAQPPVCRIIDYSKFLYQLKKRQKEQKAKQVKVNVKEIRFGPQTDDHDYNFKLKHAKGFLEDGDKIQISPKKKEGVVKKPAAPKPAAPATVKAEKPAENNEE